MLSALKKICGDVAIKSSCCNEETVEITDEVLEHICDAIVKTVKDPNTDHNKDDIIQKIEDKMK